MHTHNHNVVVFPSIHFSFALVSRSRILTQRQMKPLPIVSKRSPQPVPTVTRSHAGQLRGTTHCPLQSSRSATSPRPPRLPSLPLSTEVQPKAACPSPHATSSEEVSISIGGNSMERKGKRAQIVVSSSLDGVPVDGCLEYLTRPHSSWDSVNRFMERRQERLENCQASIVARSLAASRRSSFASSVATMNSSIVSVATAPAGFPRTALNASKTYTGSLRPRGRLLSGTSSSVTCFAAPTRLSHRSNAKGSGGVVAARLHSLNKSATPNLVVGGSQLSVGEGLRGSYSVMPSSAASSVPAAGRRPILGVGGRKYTFRMQ